MTPRRESMFQPGERVRDEIAALRPTAEEDASWAMERRHHAWVVFCRASMLPAAVVVATTVISRGGWGGRRGLLISLAIAAMVGGVGWLSQWKFIEGPRRRLTSLRASRLLAALREEDLEDRERRRKLEV